MRGTAIVTHSNTSGFRLTGLFFMPTTTGHAWCPKNLSLGKLLEIAGATLLLQER